MNQPQNPYYYQPQQNQPQPLPNPQPQPQPIPNPQQTQELANQQIAQERKQLSDYRQQLVQIHQDLKQKQSLFEGLNALGINSLEDFQSYQKAQNAQANQPAQQDQTAYNPPEEDGLDDLQMTEREKKLQKEVQDLKQMAYRQQFITERNTLKDQIKDVINEDDYPMLSKSLSNRDDSVIENIMHNRMQYLNQYKQELKLEDALKYAEGNLQNIFKRLGGEIKKTASYEMPTPKVGPNTPAPGQAPAPTTQLPPPPAQATPQQQTPHAPAPTTQLPPYSSESPIPQTNSHKPPAGTNETGFQRDLALKEFLQESGVN